MVGPENVGRSFAARPRLSPPWRRKCQLKDVLAAFLFEADDTVADLGVNFTCIRTERAAIQFGRFELNRRMPGWIGFRSCHASIPTVPKLTFCPDRDDNPGSGGKSRTPWRRTVVAQRASGTCPRQHTSPTR